MYDRLMSNTLGEQYKASSHKYYEAYDDNPYADV